MTTDPTSLDNLHDIVAPPAAPWWPPAPGWYWLFVFVAIVTFTLLIRALLRWQHNRYRREALAQLAKQEPALKKSETRAAAVATLNDLLKRCALSAWPRESVASLTGKPWHAFLDQSARTTTFYTTAGPLLESITFDPRSAASLTDAQLHQLTTAIRYWIKRHRVSFAKETAA